MRILSIETSCDETAAAIVEKKSSDKYVHVLSSIVSSSLSFHAKTGGIIPEIAAREQLKCIIPVINQAFTDAQLEKGNIDAIAVTIGPGLIGSLLVGVETAKTLSFSWNKPIIPVNHLFGHIYANFIYEDQKQEIEFPALAMVVSGGHTDLVLMNSHKEITWLGGTRDDAAGEAFDKIGRMLRLPYPSGATIEQKAKLGNVKRFQFPRPLATTDTLDFSFSGLKTAAFREIQKIGKIDDQTLSDICASIQQAIIDVLIKKLVFSAEKYHAKSILIGGGVAANRTLTEILQAQTTISVFVPDKNLCTDNAAMIGAAAFYNKEEKSWKDINANPELYFD